VTGDETGSVTTIIRLIINQLEVMFMSFNTLEPECIDFADRQSQEKYGNFMPVNG